MGRQDVLITMFIFGALRIIKTGVEPVEGMQVAGVILQSPPHPTPPTHPLPTPHLLPDKMMLTERGGDGVVLVWGGG